MKAKVICTAVSLNRTLIPGVPAASTVPATPVASNVQEVVEFNVSLEPAPNSEVWGKSGMNPLVLVLKNADGFQPGKEYILSVESAPKE